MTGAKAPAAAPHRRGLTSWAVCGSLFGLGLMIIPPGMALMLVATVVGWLAWRRHGTGGMWMAFACCAAIGALWLMWGASTKSGCPAPGEKLVKQHGKPPVTCDEIVAGYLSIASFFIVVLIVALAWPRIAERRARMHDQDVDDELQQMLDEGERRS